MIEVSRFWRDPALPFVEARRVGDGRKVCYAAHSHESFSIGVITGGRSTYINSDQCVEVGAGTTVLMNPGVVHTCNPVAGESWSYLMLFVDQPSRDQIAPCARRLELESWVEAVEPGSTPPAVDKTKVGLWHARLEDVYQQSYLQLTHSQPVGDWVLGANLGYFNGKEDGAAKAGDLDNKVYQGSFSAKTGNNTFTAAYQQLRGDTKFLRVDGASGGSLVNDAFTASFDNPEERSWQLRHDYNFAGLGIPGLTLMNRYISGDNIKTASNDDAEEWGRESELAYTIQEGSLKNLSVRWRNSNIRRDVGQDFHENRLIINYPLSIL